MANDTTFVVDAAFRLKGRAGPVVVGRFAPDDPLEGLRPKDVLGKWLIAVDDPHTRIEVVGVELHSVDGSRGLTVRPDLGDSNLVGKGFRLELSRDIHAR